MKVVINACYGGFSISLAAAQHMAAAGSLRAQKEIAESKGHFYGHGYVEGMDGTYDRADPLLVFAVESLGDKASGDCANLKVVEIPDGVEWEIEEYDGIEHIAEAHRTWI